MLKSITFKYYKAFQRKTKLEIKPLTILVGPNNAGKSSITNLFSMFKQSTSGNYQPNSLFVLDGKEGIDGPLNRIINYECMVSGRPMEIGLDLDLDPSDDIIEQDKTMISDKEKSYKSELQLHNYEQLAIEMPDEYFSGLRIDDSLVVGDIIEPGLSEVFNFFDFSNNNCSLHFKITPKSPRKKTFEQKIIFIDGPLDGYGFKIMEFKDNDAFFKASGASMENIVSISMSKNLVKKLEKLNKKLTNNIFSSLSINEKEDSSFNNGLKDIKKTIDKFEFSGVSRMGNGILNYHSRLWIEEDSRYYWWEQPQYSSDGSDFPFIQIPKWLRSDVESDKFQKSDEPKRFQNFYFRWNRPIGREFSNRPSYSKDRKYENIIYKYLGQLASFQKIISEIVGRRNGGRLTQDEETIILECLTNFFYQQFITLHTVADKIVDSIIKKYSYHTDRYFNRVNFVEIRENSPAASYKRKELIEFIGAPAWLFTDDISLNPNIVQGFQTKQLMVNKTRLLEAVNNDLKNIGIKFDLSIEIFGARGSAVDIDKRFSFLLTNHDGHVFGLHEIGYGLSQLIPLLIRKNYFSMLKQNNSTTIIREPEANIHPSLQAKLASNIIATIKNDNYKSNVIVETHSEHFIRGVQIAVAKGDIKNSDVNILYVNQSKDGKSRVKKLELEEKGKFKSEWPKGFFDTGLREVMEIMKKQ